MDNVEIILAAVRTFFARQPNGELRKSGVPSLTGIEMPSVHPVLQLMCGGPGSPYDHGPRADALRGILVRQSAVGGTTYSLSTKGAELLGLDQLGYVDTSNPLVDVETIADVLVEFDGRQFTSLEFVHEFAQQRAERFDALISRYGRDDGEHYSATSHVANSLARYARRWVPESGLLRLVFDGFAPAPVGKTYTKVGRWRCGEPNDELIADFRAILGSPEVTETERSQLLRARIGQGRFRQSLLDYWRSTCPVTGCCDARVLIASHIKRWCDSDNRERLDPFNGLLLTPNVDRLFDQHLLSFSDTGSLLLSARIRPLLLAELGLKMEASISLDARHHPYLFAHRARMFMLDDGWRGES